MNYIFNYFANKYLYVLLALFLALFPYLTVGFYFDDIYNSVTKGVMIYNENNLLEFIYTHVKQWIVVNGRFYPIGLITSYVGWYVYDNLIISRLFQITMAIANIYLMYLILSVTVSRLFAITFVLILTAFFQFNPRWDGLASFVALNQLVLLFILLSVFYLLQYIHSRNSDQHLPLVSSIIFIILSLLTYEIGVCALLACFCLAYLHYKEKPDLINFYFKYTFIACTIFVFVYLAIKNNAVGGYDGVILGSFSGFIKTFLYQSASSFPFSTLNNKVIANNYNFIVVFLFFSVFMLFWLLHIKNIFSHGNLINIAPDMKHCDNYDKNKMLFPFLLSLILLFFPSLIISITIKYQEIISFGDPYSVVYIQYFGAALIVNIIIFLISRNLSRKSRFIFLICFSIFISVASATTISVNITRITKYNKIFKEPRNALEKLIASKFMSDIPPNSVLVVNSQHMWEASDDYPPNLCSAFFSHHLGKRIHCISSKSIFSSNAHKFLSENIYVLDRLESGRVNKFSLHGGGHLVHAELTRKQEVIFTRKSVSTKPVIWGLGNGFYDWEGTSSKKFIWGRKHSEIYIHSYSDGLSSLSLDLMTIGANSVTIKLNGDLLYSGRADSELTMPYNFELRLLAGRNKIDILVDGTAFNAPNDPRSLYLKVSNISIH